MLTAGLPLRGLGAPNLLTPGMLGAGLVPALPTPGLAGGVPGGLSPEAGEQGPVGANAAKILAVLKLQKEIQQTELQLKAAQAAGNANAAQTLQAQLQMLQSQLQQLMGGNPQQQNQAGTAPAGGAQPVGGAAPAGGAPGGGAPRGGAPGGAAPGGGAPAAGGAPNLFGGGNRGGAANPFGGGNNLNAGAPARGSQPANNFPAQNGANPQGPAAPAGAGPAGAAAQPGPGGTNAVPSPALQGSDKDMAASIENQLQGTPLANKGLGAHFVAAGKQNNVDPMALVAISKQETNFGKLGVGVDKHMGVGAWDNNPNAKTPYNGAVQQIYSGAKTFDHLRTKGGADANSPMDKQLAAVNKAGWASDKNWHNGVSKNYNKIVSKANEFSQNQLAKQNPAAPDDKKVTGNPGEGAPKVSDAGTDPTKDPKVADAGANPTGDASKAAAADPAADSSQVAAADPTADPTADSSQVAAADPTADPTADSSQVAAADPVADSSQVAAADPISTGPASTPIDSAPPQQVADAGSMGGGGGDAGSMGGGGGGGDAGPPPEAVG